MRILFSANPLYGHIIPQLPLARALRDQGHAVAFVSAASVAGLFASEGFEHLVAGPEAIPDMVVEFERRTGVNLLEDGVDDESEAEMFAAIRPDLGYQAACDAARDWKPDLIVAEMFDYIAPMIGSALGVPFASLAYGPAVRPESLELLRARAEERHREFGLDYSAPKWYLDTCPPGLQQRSWQAPETHVLLRPEAYSGGAASPATPASVAGTRARPRVLVSFGTIFVIPEIITPIVRELLKQDLDIRVALGPIKTAADFDLDSDRVEYVGFTPLEQLLGDVDVVLTVGGAGTVLGSLAHGIPMVMTPINADQPVHAGRAADAGTGIAFEIGEAEPQAVAAAVAAVLAVPGYRRAAQRIAAEIAAMPTPTEVAELLLVDLD